MDFADFYQATSHRTLRYAYGLTGDLQQAQDVTQEAYTRAWQRWRQVSGYDNVEAWLRLVVNRLVQDWWRHLRVRSRARLEAPAPLPGPTEDAVLLAAALKQLPKTQARALALFYLLDLPVGEIAAETGAAESTVRSWLSRGRAGLADRLRSEADMSRVPDVSDVAAAGERRRRTRVVTAVTAASLAVLLLLGMAVAVLRARHPDHPVTPAPSGTALRRIGEPLPTAREAYTRIVDDRAFVAGYQDGALRVTALNATDGHLMWTQTVAGPHYELSLMNVIGGELVIVDLAADTTTSAAIRNQITVLDLTDGRTLWQRELAGGTSTEPGELPTLTEKVAILTAGEAGAMRAFDWRTGRQRWSLPAGARTLIEPALRAGGNVDIPHGGIDRISTADVFYRADGTTLRAYDLASGRPTGQQWTGLPPGVGDARNLLWHGKLYLVTDTRLSTVDLGGDGPTVGYTAHPTVPGTRVTSRLNGLVPCAGDAICLTDGGNPNDEAGRNPYQVVLLRTGAAPVTRDLGTDDWIVPRGALVCLERGGILDDQLRVATPAALAGFGTVGVDTGGTALLAREPEVSLAYETHAVHLFALQVATQATTDLGEIMAVPGSLAAGDHRLLALTAEGAALYAY